MKIPSILALMAAALLPATAKTPGPKPPPPEKAFVLMVGTENRITISGEEYTGKQIEAVLVAYVASSDSPAVVIEIDDIEAPGKRRAHVMEILEQVAAKSGQFDHWFAYSQRAKTLLDERGKARQDIGDKPDANHGSVSEEDKKPRPDKQ